MTPEPHLQPAAPDHICGIPLKTTPEPLPPGTCGYAEGADGKRVYIAAPASIEFEELVRRIRETDTNEYGVCYELTDPEAAGLLRAESEKREQIHREALNMGTRNEERLEADLTASRALVAKLAFALQDTTEECMQLLKDLGDCDHSVGICCCELKRRIESATAALALTEGQCVDRIKELEAHLKGCMQDGGLEYFTGLVRAAESRAYNAECVARQCQDKLAAAEAARKRAEEALANLVAAERATMDRFTAQEIDRLEKAVKEAELLLPARSEEKGAT